MLENRDYMRAAPEFSSGPRHPVTITLLILNASIYFLQAVLHAAGTKFPFEYYFGLSFEGLRHGFVWQPLTFQFLHGGLFHLLINSWLIYVFGRAVEEALDRTRFIQLYLLSGVLGGVLHVLGSLAFPSHFGVRLIGEMTNYTPVVGASAGLFGLIAAFATLFPRQELTVYLFFFFPVTVTARVLFGVSAFIAVVGMLWASDNVAHAAHLGGMLTGFAFIRLLQQTPWIDPRSAGTSRRRPQFISAPAGKLSGRLRRPSETEAELPPGEFISREVDPILEKISAHGIQSLTDRERKILEAARKKMERR